MINYLDVLGKNGLVAKRLDNYEIRPEQEKMAEKVEQAIFERRHLLVEAGTGVGKSFAYLVPAILYATQSQQEEVFSPDIPDTVPDSFPPDYPAPPAPRGNSEGIAESDETDDFEWDPDKPVELRQSRDSKTRRIVVSTHTIALQEQLFTKDIPFLASVLPFEFSSVLIKGRGNYICLRRFNNALMRAPTLFTDDEKTEEFTRISKWCQTTQDGSLADLDPRPNSVIWDEVSCEQGNCLGRACRFRNKCFYQKARRQVQNASIIIVNHALLFSDLAVRAGGGAILPNYDILIFDEAHTMEHVASDHLGLSVSAGQIEYLLARLYNEHNFRGILSKETATKTNLFGAGMTQGEIQNLFVNARNCVSECRSRAEEFFASLTEWLKKHTGSNGRIVEPEMFSRGLEESLHKLMKALRLIADTMDDEETRAEFGSAQLRITTLIGALSSWIEQKDSGMVYWLEEEKAKFRQIKRVQLIASPVNVGPALNEYMFSKIPSVIMTSATLTTSGTPNQGMRVSTGKENPFRYFQSRIGLDCVDTLQLGSPFNYKEQVTLILPDYPKNTHVSDADFPDLMLGEMIYRYIRETEGGAFVLFTSYTTMRIVLGSLGSHLDKLGYPLLVQGGGMNRTKMVAQFQRNRNSVLFGTDSFWQGVNVPGDALRNVIITKLPFAVYTHPLNEARKQAIDLNGGNGFRDLQLPHAIVKFKQGFGRLIRSATDKGIVVVLDPRICTKTYGRDFLQALPQCTLRIDKLPEP